MQGGVSGYWADEADVANKSQSGDAALSNVYFYLGKHWKQPMDADGFPVGEPEWFDAPFVHIEIPGDAKLVIDKLAFIDERRADSHNRRFPKQWEAFQAGRQAELGGTALIEWPLLLRSQVDALRQRNIYTVEQLAALPDGNAQFLGGLDLREKAKKWLLARDASAKSSDVSAMESRLVELEAQNAKLLALAEGQKRGPGRPPKSQATPE